MAILIQILLLIIGFVMLVKGADWFVEGAAGIAEKTGLSQLVIGLTIVAMGTSAPEAAISIASALKGSAGIAVGNVLGSNIMNVLLILGITAIITPLAVKVSTVKYEIPFVLAISLILGFIGLSNGVLSRADGAVLWILFLCYMGYLFVISKAKSDEDIKNELECELEMEIDAVINEKPKSVPVLLIFLIIGGFLIVFGSDVTVDAATAIAKVIGISDRVIGLTIVAFGTSLPELVTCITAARKNNADIAIGNIVGSNIFNILFVLGTSALIVPISYGMEFLLDTILCVASVVLLWLCVINKDLKLKRWGGIIMLAGYAAYFVNTAFL